MKPIVVLVAGALASVVVGRGVAAAAIVHVPPADAPLGAAVELVVDAPAETPTLVAHVRTTGMREFRAIELVRRDDGRWLTVVTVAMPGLDYYLAAGGEPVFATPAWPHTLVAREDAETLRRGRDDVRSARRRSRIHTAGEYVDYGYHTDASGARIADRYYRIDADFSYRLWAYPLEEIRVGYTRLLGDARMAECPGGTSCSEVGFKVAGWFELGLAAVEGVHLDARGMVMATAAGFAVGGRAEARLGTLDASHVAVGVESLADVGTAGYFRLGWGTVARTPMAATVEVTNLPSSTRPTGVRFFYDLGRELGGGVRASVRVGYAARTQEVAGIAGGAGLTVDF